MVSFSLRISSFVLPRREMPPQTISLCGYCRQFRNRGSLSAIQHLHCWSSNTTSFSSEHTVRSCNVPSSAFLWPRVDGLHGYSVSEMVASVSSGGQTQVPNERRNSALLTGPAQGHNKVAPTNTTFMSAPREKKKVSKEVRVVML